MKRQETVARFNQQIEEYYAPFEVVIELLDTILGVEQQTAEMLVSEIEVDMSCVPLAAHLVAWAGLAPGNYESAGKHLSGKTRKGNQTLRSGLMPSAHVAFRSRTYLAVQYRWHCSPTEKKRAMMAVPYSPLVIADHVIQRREPDRELGANYFDQLCPETTTKKLVKRLSVWGIKSRFNPKLLLQLPNRWSISSEYRIVVITDKGSAGLSRSALYIYSGGHLAMYLYHEV